MTGRRAIAFAAVALIALGSGYLVHSSLRNASQPEELTVRVSPRSAEAILAASLPDLQGKNQSISQWRGKVLVVNFWATWCEPCRNEIPEFIKTQNRYRKQGLLFVGIAVDQKENVAAYTKEIGINYPVLVGDFDAIELSRQAGNSYSGLPFTAIIDRDGKIASAQLGGLTEAKLETIVKPLL